MILGTYYLTYVREDEPGNGKLLLAQWTRSMLAYKDHIVGIHAPDQGPRAAEDRWREEVPR